MVGQKPVLDYLETLILDDRLPNFIIICGARGCGKSALMAEMYKMYARRGNAANRVKFEVSVGDVRKAIELANKIKGDALFCEFPNADKMSPAAKNALLKIVEEPPKNVYFLMSLEDINNTLETLQSRATVINMLPYSPTDIGEYAKKYKFNSDEMSVIANVCETPGEVDMLHEYGVMKFYNYVQTVVDHIATVSGANCFKISDRLHMKDDDDGYDIKIFLKAFITECSNRLASDVSKYAAAIKITSKTLQSLNITGVAKQSLIDVWILDIRREWMQ